MLQHDTLAHDSWMSLCEALTHYVGSPVEDEGSTTIVEQDYVEDPIEEDPIVVDPAEENSAAETQSWEVKHWATLRISLT